MASSIEPLHKITLYRGFPGTNHYVWSPFVNKLEARFRFTGLSYRSDIGSPLKGPRGKIPYVEISKNSESGGLVTPTTTGDTTLIVSKLVEDGVVEDLNANLSPAEKAHDLAVRALLEDKLAFYQV